MNSKKFQGFLLGYFQGIEYCFPIGIDTLDVHFLSCAEFASTHPVDVVTLVVETIR